ncbi:MAG TPA: hypothetical protein P5081_10415 [Phycisphaerae bacterium]|nr:hypothetical protein [Phycisphaerae bacterium]HRW53290.1 hypothetical protein [Phycisphaerae bacterium]
MSARCSICSVSIGLGELLDKDATRARASEPIEDGREAPETPKRIRRWVSDGELKIVFRWYHLVFWWFIIGGLVWNGFTIHILVSAAHRGTLPFTILSTCAHSTAGVFIMVFAILGLVNRTEVDINGERISVRVGPIRLRKRIRVNVHDIRQLYCRRKEGTIGSLIGAFELVAIREDNSPVCLVDCFAEAEELRCIERAIERHLGLPDRRVEGEYLGGIDTAETSRS